MTTEIEELLKPLRLAVAEQVSPHFTKYLQQLKLKNLFLNNQIDEITIRVNQSGRPTVKIKKYKSFDQLKKEVEGLKKKGTFKDMLIKTRDGNIQYFEQIELVKL